MAAKPQQNRLDPYEPEVIRELHYRGVLQNKQKLSKATIYRRADQRLRSRRQRVSFHYKWITPVIM